MEQTQPQNEQQKRHERRFYMIGHAFAFVAYGILFLTLDVETELSWTHPYFGVGFLIAAYFLIVAPCLDALLSKMERFVKKMWLTLWVVSVLAVMVALFQALETIPYGDWRWRTLLYTVMIFLILGVVVISICPIRSLPDGLRVMGGKLKSIGTGVRAIGSRLRDSARKYLLVGVGTVLAITILTIGISAKFNLSNITANPYMFIEDYFDQWSVFLGASVTAILAVIAFWSIMENRRIRLEDRELEFKRRSMDEVVNWIREVQKRIYMPTESESPSISALGVRWYSLVEDGHFASREASIFEKEFETKVSAVRQSLYQVALALPDDWADLSKNENKVKLQSTIMSFWESAAQALEAAYKLKVKHKL